MSVEDRLGKVASMMAQSFVIGSILSFSTIISSDHRESVRTNGTSNLNSPSPNRMGPPPSYVANQVFKQGVGSYFMLKLSGPLFFILT